MNVEVHNSEFDIHYSIFKRLTNSFKGLEPLKVSSLLRMDIYFTKYRKFILIYS